MVSFDFFENDEYGLSDPIRRIMKSEEVRENIYGQKTTSIPMVFAELPKRFSRIEE